MQEKEKPSMKEILLAYRKVKATVQIRKKYFYRFNKE